MKIKTAIWGLVCALICALLIGIFPEIYGLVSGGVIGILFADFLARHETLYLCVQFLLSATYTLLVVSAFDFLFLYMGYMLLNVFFKRGGSWRDIARLSFRALSRLLIWQIILAVTFLICFRHWQGFSVFYLIPSFLSAGLVSCTYMVLWEMSVLVFCFGFAVTEQGVKAWLAGGVIAVNNFLIMLLGATLIWILSLLFAVLFNKFNVPFWVWTLFGAVLHIAWFNGIILLLLRKDNVTELFAPKS